MTDNTNTTGGNCCRISPWLICSGALNLFLVGMLSAPLFHGAPPMPPPGMPQPGMMMQPGQAMPPPFAGGWGHHRGGPEGGPLDGPQNGPQGGHEEPKFLVDRLASQMTTDDAKAFRAIYDQQESKLKSGRDQMHEAIAKVAIILRAEKPDTAALKAVLDGVENGHGQMHETMSTMIQRVASEVSQDGRKKIADFLEHMPPK